MRLRIPAGLFALCLVVTLGTPDSESSGNPDPDAASSETIRRIAFGSCAIQWKPQISRLGREPCPLVDFTSSGMTHVEPKYAAAENPYRVAGPVVEPNFGLVEIDRAAPGGATITLSAFGVDGKTAFSHSLALSELCR